MTTELSVPRGHGLVRVAHNLRQHITNPRDWGMSAGTDYWAHFGDLTLAPALAQDLVNYGWLEAGTWVQTAGSSADLISSDVVGQTGGARMDDADDAIVSPFIFGDYAHALLAGQFLGYMPTTLTLECYARLGGTSDEQDSGFGFVEAGAAADFNKGELMALVTSDGTNFSLESAAAAAASDSLDDIAAHQFKIEMKAGEAIKWSIDGTPQTNTLALQTTLFPVAFVVTTGTGGSNDPVMSWVHIYYS